MERKVAQIGWFEGNEVVPMVLVCLRDRAEIQTEKGKMVRVSRKVKGKTLKAIAIVDRQFREHLGKATINAVLATKLGNAKVKDTITIDGGVTESEAEEFSRQYQPRNPLFAMLAGLERAQQHNEDSQ
jgi:hypothetical protein